MERRCTKQRRWFITGVSSGLGRAVAELALSRGHFVAGTVRDEQAAHRFEATAPGRSLAYWTDLDDCPRLGKSMGCSCKALGGLDVLLNNAGYGLRGALEELSEDELRRHFEINFWTHVRTLRALLPTFRQQGKGHILNVCCDYPGGPGWGPGAAAAAALAALTESLAQEVAPFGVKVTRLELGPLATGWETRVESAHNPLECYSRPVLPDDAGLAVEVAAERILELVETCQAPRVLRLTQGAATVG